MSNESDSGSAPVGVRRQTMLTRIQDNVIAAILSAVIIGAVLSIWEIASGGGLVGALGGATADDLTTTNTAVKELKGEQNETDGNLATATDRLAALEARQNDVDGSLTQVSDTVAALSRRQGEADGNLATATDRLAALEARQNDVDPLSLTILPVRGAKPVRVWFGNAGGWGKWSPARYCSKDHYVCGLRQRVEPPQGGNYGDDDTAMNAVEFYCCPFPRLATPSR